MKTIVLAYSGSSAGTVAIAWLAETYGAEVVTLTLDVGQGRELTNVRERALRAGAVRAHVLDAREEFLARYVLPLLRSAAFSPAADFPGIALSRELVAARLVDIARMEGADAVAHAFDRSDGDRRRHFEECVRQCHPAATIVSAAADWHMTATELADYVRSRDVTLPPSAAQPCQANVLGRVISGGHADEGYVLTRAVSDAPDEPAFLELDVDGGVPARANGVEMTLIEMIESIETIAGTHGVGRLPAAGGAVAESPAAVVLHTAFRELSTGRAGDRHLRGTVRLRLFKGTCDVAPIPEPVI